MPSHRVYYPSGMKGDLPATMEKITRGITGTSGKSKPHIEYMHNPRRYRGRRGVNIALPPYDEEKTLAENEQNIISTTEQQKADAEANRAQYQDAAKTTIDPVTDTVVVVKQSNDSISYYSTSSVLPIVGIVVAGGMIYYILTRD